MWQLFCSMRCWVPPEATCSWELVLRVHSGLAPMANSGAGCWLGGGSLFSSCGFSCSKGSPWGISPGTQPGLLYVIEWLPSTKQKLYASWSLVVEVTALLLHLSVAQKQAGPATGVTEDKPLFWCENGGVEARGWEGGCSHFESNPPRFSCAYGSDAQENRVWELEGSLTIVWFSL